MPVELSFIPTRNPDKPIYTLVMPGEVSVFLDLSSEPPEELGILCEDDDSCGRIIRLDQITFGPGGRPIGEARQEEHIATGEHVERAVVTDEGEDGTLVMNHLAYSAINHALHASVN